MIGKTEWSSRVKMVRDHQTFILVTTLALKGWSGKNLITSMYCAHSALLQLLRWRNIVQAASVH